MKKISYDERATFYDYEVSKDKDILNFLKVISKKLDIEKIVYCPCASGIYASNFSKIYKYSYFADINDKMLDKLKSKIEREHLNNVEAINIDLNELDKINGKSDCILMLNQGLQYISKENFEKVLKKNNTKYIIADLFDFKKKGTLTYFDSNIGENICYLSRTFNVSNKTYERYNKYYYLDNKIHIKYIYCYKNNIETTTEFELFNYKFEDILDIIDKSNYKIYCVYGNYKFKKYSSDDGHYILILRRKNI